MLKNIGSNWTLNLVQILVFMLLTPYTLEQINELGAGSFGIWEAIVSAAGPLQLLILGVPMATVRAISGHIARDEQGEANRALGASLSLTLGLGLVALLAGGLVLWLFEAHLLSQWALSPERLADARLATMIVIANLAMGFALRLPYAVYDAYHDFIPRNLVMAAGFLCKLGLTVLLLEWSTSLTTLAVVQVLITLLEFGLAVGVLRRRHPQIKIRPKSLDWPRARSILAYSVFAMLLNMGALLAFRLDALVVGFERSEVEVQTYALGNKIFDPFINLLLAIAMVVMPMAASLKAKGRASEVAHMLLKWSKVAVNLVLLVGGYLMVLGPEFLECWLGASYTDEVGRLMQVLMLSFFIFLPVRGVALPLLMGIGHARTPALLLLGMGLSNLVLSLILVREHGVMGVALGTAIPNVLFGCMIGAVACSVLQVRAREYLGYALGRSLLGLVLPIGFLLAIKYAMQPVSFVQLIPVGLVFALLFGLCQVYFVFKDDRHLNLHALLCQALGKGGAR